MNSFQEFKPNRVEIIGHDGREFTKRLDNAYYDISIQDDGRTIKLFEKQIKKEWWENTDNFPILLIRKKVWKMFAMPNFDIRMINEQGWRLATKAELLSLYAKEDND